MPPRYAYWTILIDGKATAFRAKEREELLPTLNQLRRKSGDVTLRYFARGKLWDSPEQAQWAGRNAPAFQEKRNRDWRPGGAHKDPRARFDKPKGRSEGGTREGRGEWTLRPDRQQRDERGGAKPFAGGPPREQRGAHGKQPWNPKTQHERRPDRQDRSARPHNKSDRPWTPKPHGESRGRSDWRPKAGAGRQEDRWRTQSDRERQRPDTRRENQRPDKNPRRPENQARGRSEFTGGRDRDTGWKPQPRGDQRRPWTPRPGAKPTHPKGAVKGGRGPADRARSPHAKDVRGRGSRSGDDRRRDDWRKRPDVPEGPDERREAVPPPPREARPDKPPAAEKIVTRPEPPERG